MGLGWRGAGGTLNKRTGESFLVTLLLFCGFWKAHTQADDGKSVYFWETGPWGRCMGSDCGPGGSQSRAVWCAHVDGWTTLHTNCDQGQRPSNQRNCFRVCDWHKDLYDWKLGAWNECVPVSARTFGAPRLFTCSGGEEGIQTREVGCMLKSDGSPAEDAICEYFEPKPRLEQACLIPCPQDCVVSEYSPWTSCSKTCGTGLRNRVRSVLVPPLFGGSICPNLTEFQSCKPGTCTGPEGLYSLRVGPWSPCALPQTRTARQAKRRKGKGQGLRDRAGVKDPETRELIQKKRSRNRLNRQESPFWDIQVGFQTREVICIHRNGSSVGRNLCMPRDLPLTIQSCILPKDCQVTEWTEWSSCSKTCVDPESLKGNRTRRRQVLQFPVGEGEECPPLEEMESCEPRGESLPPCTTYMWRTTEWSDCRVDLLLSQQDRRRSNVTGLCGGGLQTREVYCVQANAELLKYLNDLREKEKAGQTQRQLKPSVPPLLSVTFQITASRPVENQLCKGPIPNTSQLCQIPCPIDCEVSPWGAWGPCVFENCDDQTGKKGFKLRRRRITNEPSGGPGNCPHLAEAMPCDEPSCYNWQLLGLDECVPDDGKPCGPGTQPPQVRCINSNGERREASRADHVMFAELSGCNSFLLFVDGSATGSGRILHYRTPSGGALCPNSSALQEVQNCNEHPCMVYHWQTGSWGPCTEDPSASTLNTSAGSRVSPSGDGSGLCSMGVQTRKVMCVRVGVGQVPPKKCPDAPRPSTMRSCQLPCKKDCIVTPFSDWTECPGTCDAAGDAVKRKQSRKRLVIQMPSNEGQECPEVLEEERDCEVPKVCPGFRWKTHKWRKCQLVPWSLRKDSPGAQETCGPGLQTRAVSCRQLDGTQADISECLRSAKAMPAITQRCQLPCQDDCQLTNWSKFSSCTADCVGVRTRKRALIGRSKKKDKCKNTQMYPLSETQYCPCDKYNAQPVGKWSDCILPEGGRVESTMGMKVQGDIKECGQGYRYQAMVCYDQDNRLVETSRCNSQGYIEEACIIPCPSDCKLSEWSNWSRCSKSCGSGVKVRSKWLREKPYNGGRPCPKLDHINQAQVYEVVPCQSDCNQYVWVTEPWSVWKVSNVDLKENCGEGVQTRKVRCMLNTVDGPSESVEDYLCDPEEMPLGARESRLPCPEDCVLNDWGPWSRCSMPCTSNNSRARAAYALRYPTVGRQCPETTDREPCRLNLNCFNYFYNITGKMRRQRSVVQASQGDGRPCPSQMEQWKPCPVRPCYRWQYSPWSECRVESVVCGHGTRYRNLSCFVSDGSGDGESSMVDEELCSSLELAVDRDKQIILKEACVLPCPGGCPAMNPPEDNSSCDPPCLMPRSFCSEAGVCMCDEGFTEVLSSDGQLTQCAPIPILEIPTAGDKKGDVKTSRAVNPTLPTTVQPGRTGRTWYLQPYGPDGKLKMWVYGVAAGAFVLLIFIVSMIYLACSLCAKVHHSLKTQEPDTNGTAMWTGQNSHEMVYICPECQELTQNSSS
ncbi:thrombospondin type-1 domain-containing protein 7A [Nematolebias whitei]|uniref:thrombospondin type-1 domain-containing protein 7A n=1 Tax=Nematolebias whitei TaxID=451745 RepID=UPI001898ABEB|nr:thrombospondin type-1 domain-containing protein 7A [Nematolebias whitei]